MFQLGSKLLDALETNRLARGDETVKGIGWFLVCVGESLEKGALVKHRRNKRERDANGASVSLAEAFCAVGDQVMDWGTGVYHQERKHATKQKRKGS